MKPPKVGEERTEVPVLKLKVTEALSKDVGRGIARMGPEDLEKLQLAIGDMVEVDRQARDGLQGDARPQGTPWAIPPPDRRAGARKRRNRAGRVRDGAQDQLPSGRPRRAGPGQRPALRARHGLYRQFARRPAGTGGNPHPRHALRRPVGRLPGGEHHAERPGPDQSDHTISDRRDAAVEGSGPRAPPLTRTSAG